MKEDLQGILGQKGKPSKWNTFKYHLYTGLEIFGRAAANVLPGGTTAQAYITKADKDNIVAYVYADLLQGVYLLASLSSPVDAPGLLVIPGFIMIAKCMNNTDELLATQARRNNEVLNSADKYIENGNSC